MPDLRPVQESVLEVSDTSWIIGDRLLLSLQPTKPLSGCSWSDGQGVFYTISEVSGTIPVTRPLSSTSPIRLVHSAGDCNAAWAIGEAFLKVQEGGLPSRTHEHITLDYLNDLANREPFSFRLPHALYHNEFNGSYFLVTSRVPGDTLEVAWQHMGEATKQTCVEQVVGVCQDLARQKGDKICGVDGGELSDTWMKPPNATDQFSHQVLLSYCQDIGMDCSSLVLHHCDLGPSNIVVDLSEGCTVGVIDWEMTGFVPKDWIRTKFCVCWAMDFDFPGQDIEKSKDWRERVQFQLAREGFAEVADAWKKRFRDLLK
ncbi:hypothetical protein PG984_009049 [Apiospora sp. TS-2023a]